MLVSADSIVRENEENVKLQGRKAPCESFMGQALYHMRKIATDDSTKDIRGNMFVVGIHLADLPAVRLRRVLIPH